ncbi:MAG: hypothetical protein EOO42_01355 [Flavobacteriales bacterium]|nr:MAG: hypothetical protein EOO42_01355 [Flavobacteriales bacterium]
MKKYIHIICLIAAVSLLLQSCKKEKELVASPAQVFYTLPQGNQPYDQTFVKFQQDFGTYFLYKFSEDDFRWNGTSRLLFMAKNAEEANIQEAYDFIKKAFLDDYTKEKLQQLLPYKILLSAGVHQLTANLSKPTGFDTVATNIGFYTGVNHVTFGYANSTLSTLTPVRKLELQANLHKSFFSYALSREKIAVPSAFSTPFNITGNSATAYKGLGFLEFVRSYTVSQDFATYIYTALRYNKQQFTSLYLGSVQDPSGLIATKYAIVQQYLLQEWNINTETIANRAL